MYQTCKSPDLRFHNARFFRTSVSCFVFLVKNPIKKTFFFLVSLRYLYFGVLPHLRGKNSVPTQFWSLQVPSSCIWRDCPHFWYLQIPIILQNWWFQSEQTWTTGKRAALPSSHLTNKAVITPQLIKKEHSMYICLQLLWYLPSLCSLSVCSKWNHVIQNLHVILLPDLQIEERTRRMSCAEKPLLYFSYSVP
jgi:hypothetical protein